MGGIRLHNQYIEEDRGWGTSCWIWQGCMRRGYGLITRNNKSMQAHVFFWEQKHGAVTPGKVLDHLCAVRCCVNPDHLRVSTHTENIRRGNVPVISLSTAQQIRKDLGLGMRQIDVASKYGISQPTVSQIARGVTWK